MTAAKRRTEHFASPQGSLVDLAQPLDGDALGEAWEKSASSHAKMKPTCMLPLSPRKHRARRW